MILGEQKDTFQRHTITPRYEMATVGMENRRDFDEVQDHRLVGAKDFAAGDPKNEGVSNISCGTGDGDTNRSGHAKELQLWLN